MLVKANRAIAGRRYRTQTGTLIEISVSDTPDQFGQTVPRFEPRTGCVLFHRVDEKTGEANKSVLHPVGFSDYLLEDGLSEEESKKIHFKGPGRKKHPDRTWRGWAWHNKRQTEAVLSLARERGCYVKETANYYSIGFNGATLCALYRNGDMGFSKPHPHLEKHYAFSKKKNAGFCEYWLPLRMVGGLQRFLEHFNFFITEEKERLTKEKRGASK